MPRDSSRNLVYFFGKIVKLQDEGRNLAHRSWTLRPAVENNEADVHVVHKEWEANHHGQSANRASELVFMVHIWVQVAIPPDQVRYRAGYRGRRASLELTVCRPPF